jgi:hypothetical protein
MALDSYTCCAGCRKKEIPFYVGQTQSVWGRMNDYHWAEFQASTDFQVGEAVRYLNTKKRRVVAKYRVSADRKKEENAIIHSLQAECFILLNKTPGYNYRTSTPDKERAKVLAFMDNIMKTSGAHI